MREWFLLLRSNYSDEKRFSLLLFLLLTRFAAVGQVAPTLQFTPANGVAALSWYDGSGSLFSLQSTTNLSAPITWTDVPFTFNSGIWPDSHFSGCDDCWVTSSGRNTRRVRCSDGGTRYWWRFCMVTPWEHSDVSARPLCAYFYGRVQWLGSRSRGGAYFPFVRIASRYRGSCHSSRMGDFHHDSLRTSVASFIWFACWSSYRMVFGFTLVRDIV
jgi:hypothetical protein